MKDVFVSCHLKDEAFYKSLEAFSITKRDFTVYRDNLRVRCKGVASSLFRTDEIVEILNYPDIALVVLSPSYLKDKWLEAELHALVAIEQRQRKKFILPVMIANVDDSKLPLYLRENKDIRIDLREKGGREEKMEELASRIAEMAQPVGKVFIGHGRSLEWMALKDFLQNELRLEYEEFNRVAPEGKATKERLTEMLDNSSFAFLVMTAEDEHADETIHARENVVHEVGLFQGKLGFERAIILLEEGCTEFSNIAGTIQMRFPRGSIDACFEKIRRVLKREGIV